MTLGRTCRNDVKGLVFLHHRYRFVAFFAAMLPLFIPTEVEAKTALLVVGNTTLSVGDTALKSRLNYYYTVSVLDDSANADTSKDLIVISASVDPALVGTKYKFTPKGVLVMKPELFDDMGMTAAGAFGTLSAQTMLKINAPTHQMAGGFSLGLVAVYGSGQTVGWGTPAASSSRVAVTADGNSSHVTIFGYKSGQAMVNFTAPGRRVGYYLFNLSSITVEGGKLFDYAVDWADGNVPPVSGGSTSAISWSSTSTITRYAAGCDSFSMTWAMDDQLYSSYSDCFGVTGTVTPKRSLGYVRIIGMPADGLLLDDIDTGAPGVPDIDRTDSGSGLDATGNGTTGKKASGMLQVSGRSYIWVRNMTSGMQSALKYTDNYNLANATWKWASWTLTEFGYPVFVQYGKGFAGGGAYAYVVAHDNPSAYAAADRFVLMRVPVASILVQNAYEFFSGTVSQPAWVSFANRANRTAIFSHKGRCARNGMTYNGARGRYYWWQQIPVTKFHPGNGLFGGFGIYSAPNPWGPWIPVYYNEKWDVGPGERGEFPTKWMSSDPISSRGEMYLVFSGDDSLSVRKGTIAVGY
jgi:hypothetical protein